MLEDTGFICRCCGERHDGLPFNYGVDAPAYWSPEMEHDELSELASDACVIGGEHFFIRGNIQILVHDADQDFEWGVWVSLSEANFDRTTDLWNQPGRESEPPMFGWLVVRTAGVRAVDPQPQDQRAHATGGSASARRAPAY